MDIFELALKKKRRPDKEKSKVLWNASWEKDLKNAYSKLPDQLPDLDMIINDRLKDIAEESQAAVATQNRDLQESCSRLQAKFRGDVLSSLVTKDLARQWSILNVETRRHHALEGLYRAASAEPSFELMRSWCPDMTVAELADDPQSFLDHLDVLINGDDAVLTYFPHLLVDKTLARIAQIEVDYPARPQEIALAMLVRLARVVFTTMALRGIYLSFEGLHEIYRSDPRKKEKIRVIKPVGNTQGEKDGLKQLQDHLTKLGRAAKSDNRCWGCGVHENQLPPGTTLQACARCKKINRTILYCSRECQKDDWRDGGVGFLPHKEVCGNSTRTPDHRDGTFRSAQAEPRVFHTVGADDLMKLIPSNKELEHSNGADPFEQSIVAVPRSGGRFKKSAALLLQVQLLKRPNPPDYVMLQDTLEMLIRMPVELPFKAEFAEAKRRAMEDGDVAAVERMYQILKPQVELFAPREYDLAKQLEAEYGVILPKCTGLHMSLQDHMDKLELAKK